MTVCFYRWEAVVRVFIKDIGALLAWVEVDVSSLQCAVDTPYRKTIFFVLVEEEVI